MTFETRNGKSDVNGLAEDISRISRHLKRFLVPQLSQQKENQRKIIDQALAVAEKAEETLKRQREYIERLEGQTRTDDLTGLLNRRGFIERVRATLSEADRFDDEGLLIYIDLDNFKPINDAFGHATGDKILVHVANLLTKSVRQNDAVARIGGDEFAIMMPRSNHFNSLAQAERLEKAVNSSCISVNGQFIAIQASFGVQPFDGDDEPNTIMARADNAMYRTKLERKGLSPRTYAA